MPAAQTAPQTRAEIAVPRGFELAWHDEFDGDGPPSAADYATEQGRLRNHEAQTYTSRPENVRKEGGLLVIEARQESLDGAAYTSASLTTRGKHEFLYGRLEVRARIPAGRGTWPAIWLLSSDVDQVGWPRCGEIDVMENVGFEPQTLHATVHTEAYNHLKGTQKTGTIELPRPWQSFHIYRLDWEEHRLSFFVDEQRVLTFDDDRTGRVETWPYAKPEYLIMNVAIGGDWGGQHGIADSIFPLRMEVDYVRYFRRNARTAGNAAVTPVTSDHEQISTLSGGRAMVGDGPG